MPQPLPQLVSDTYDGQGNLVEHVDLRVLETWRPLVIAYIKAWAGEILSTTDWQEIKAFGLGVPLAPDLAAARQLVRDTTNVVEAQLLAATNLAEFDAVAWQSSLSVLDPTIQQIDTTIP